MQPQAEHNVNSVPQSCAAPIFAAVPPALRYRQYLPTVLRKARSYWDYDIRKCNAGRWQMLAHNYNAKMKTSSRPPCIWCRDLLGVFGSDTDFMKNIKALLSLLHMSASIRTSKHPEFQDFKHIRTRREVTNDAIKSTWFKNVNSKMLKYWLHLIHIDVI